MAEVDLGNQDDDNNMNGFPQHDHIPQIDPAGGGKQTCGICLLVLTQPAN